MNIAPGKRIGRYEIRSILGEGGMGKVYLARDTQLDRDIALKTLTPEVARDQQRLHRFLQEAPAISPDGKTVACLSPDEKAAFKWQVAILPLDGGAVSKFIDLTESISLNVVWWTPDGRSISYIDSTQVSSNIFAQPIDGGPRKQLTNFKTDYLGTFNWTRDGKQLILGRGPSTNDVVLIKDFR